MLTIQPPQLGSFLPQAFYGAVSSVGNNQAISTPSFQPSPKKAASLIPSLPTTLHTRTTTIPREEPRPHQTLLSMKPKPATEINPQTASIPVLAPIPIRLPAPLSPTVPAIPSSIPATTSWKGNHATTSTSFITVSSVPASPFSLTPATSLVDTKPAYLQTEKQEETQLQNNTNTIKNEEEEEEEMRDGAEQKAQEIPSETASLREKIPMEIQKFERCLLREVQLLEELKQHFQSRTGASLCSAEERAARLASSSGGMELEHFDSATKLGEELRAIMESKRMALSCLMPSLHESDNNRAKEFARVLGKLPQSCMDKVMSITSQPPEVAVANRYLLPVPEVAIAADFCSATAESGASLIISAKLFYHGSGKEVATTMQGKQDILQGIRQVNVDKSGRAAFAKLKVMEVSSKHRHQSFCLVFCLEEYSPQGSKRVLTQVKSTPFHVQSRPAKRKRELPGDGTTPEEEEQQEELRKKKKKEAKKRCLVLEEQAAERSPSAPLQDCNYIDITDLLTLPQKEAARRLGISESMLCKRFKECTRRKWPYRYLRKIDKVINMLNLHKSDDGSVPREDQEKLQRLNKEREECLRPVRIRITSYDRMSPMMRLRSRAADYDEEDIPIDALETLEMLKTQRLGRNSNGGGRRLSDSEGGCCGGAVSEEGVASEPDDVVGERSRSLDGSCVGDAPVASPPFDSNSEEDEEMNEQNSNSSDFELNERAKEVEGISNLFDFGRECCMDDRMVISPVECEPVSPSGEPSNSD